MGSSKNFPSGIFINRRGALSSGRRYYQGDGETRGSGMGAGRGQTRGAGKATQTQAHGEELRGEESPDPVHGWLHPHRDDPGVPHLYLCCGDGRNPHPHLQARGEDDRGAP